jgi:hypothetical protein
MSIVRAREISLATLAAVALAGCASVGRFDPSPAHTVDLSGSWILDHAASDDPKAVIEKLRPKPVKHSWDMPPDDGTGDDTGPPEGGGQQGGGQRGGRSRRGGSQGQPQVTYRNNNDAYTHSTVLKMLQADLARESLTIRQAPDRFTLDYGSVVRNFTPGAVSVVSAAWGVADQSSGWKGKEFVIQVKPQMGVATVESFSLADDGNHLVEQLHMGGGDFPAVKLKRVYDRADHPAPRDVPTSD